MWNLGEDDCLETCKCMNANLNWTWNDHFESENPQNRRKKLDLKLMTQE